MNKVIKISKVLNTLSGIVRTMLRVAAVIIAVAVVILLFVSPDHEMWRNGTYTVGLGHVTLELIPDGAIPPEVTRLFTIGILSFCIPLLLFGGMCLRTIQDILKPMSEGKPFDKSVSSSLRKLSFITLIAGGIIEAGKIVLSAFMLHSINLDALFNPELVAGYTVDFVLDGNMILLFAVLYLMSHVFRYGEELQQLSDETL